MSKINLQDIATLTNEQSVINLVNQNSAEIETKSDSFLSRDGSSPNEMNSDFDMNGFAILNLPVPSTANEPVRLQDLNTVIGGGTITNGAPVSASYLTLGTNATLTAERVLTAGSGITLTDAGAGSTLTVSTSIRDRLSADRTYYVRTDGSDGNSGLVNNAGGAWLTINNGITFIRDRLDANGHKIVLQVGDGTYTTGVKLYPVVGVDPGGYATGELVLKGNTTTLGNVLLSVTGDSCIQGVNAHTAWKVEGFEFRTTTSGNCVVADYNSTIYLGKNKFGVSAGIHILAEFGSSVEIVDDYTIRGNALLHQFCTKGGEILTLSGKTVTISGTPAFSSAFMAAQDAGRILCSGVTYSGAATGIRWLTDDYGLIDFGGTVSTQLNTLPGNAVGSAIAIAAERGGTGQTLFPILTGSITAHGGTAIPAGGTAGAGLQVSSTTNFGIYFGSGVPTLSAAQGSLYLRSDGSSTSTRLYVNTNGTTGWTNITTAT